MNLAQSQELHISPKQISYQLTGELNRKGVKAYKSLLSSPSQDLVLNMKHVSKIDSMGIGFLLKLQEKYNRADLRLELTELPTRVQMFLEFTRTVANFAIATQQTTLKVAA